MRFGSSLAVMVAVCVCAIPSSFAKTLRVYHIGNSLTDNIFYGGLRNLASSEKDSYTYGKDVSPGVPLDYTWQGKSKTGQVYSIAPYGTYKNALKNYTWDAMTLEPFDNWLKGSTGDVSIGEDFINYALKKSPNLQTYIYERWPRRPVDSHGNFKSFDYNKLYTAKYTSSSNRYDLADERRGYFETLVNDINKALPKLKKKVDLVPVGDVFEELDKRIKANQISGIDNVTQFYQDAIHMNKMGSYVIGLTFFATMYQQDPVGSAVPGAYGSINKKLAGELQDAVWDVVSTNKLDGLHVATPALGSVVPEPISLSLLALLPLLRRRSNSRKPHKNPVPTTACD